MDAYATYSGPLFDGLAEEAVLSGCREVEDELGDYGLTMIRDLGWRTYKNPTGNYSNHLAVRREPDGVRVWDQDIVYGPWLEGVSARNRATRFKGYWLWRRMRQQLMTVADPIAESVMDRYIERMG